MSTLLKTVALLVSLLSDRAAQKLGTGLGLIWFYVIRIRRNTVLSNLETALPDRAADHLGIAKEAYRHFGIFAVEFLRMSRMEKKDIAALTDVEGMHFFEAAAAKKKGVIIVTAHFGNFDLLAASQAARGIPLAVVSRTLHERGANRFWMESRKKSGLEIFEDKGSAKKMLRHLKSGKVLAVTVDQRTRPERGGVLVPFMGYPAMTATAPAALAVASGAPVVPVRIERQADGRHKAFIEAEIPFAEPRSRADIVPITKKINEIVGRWIAACPEQYMWLHRRFMINNDYTGLSRNQ